MIGAVVLAAGSSRRLGLPKQLLPFRGRPLLQHAVDAAVAGGVDQIAVVLGHAAERVRAALELPPVAGIVVNRDHPSGQASSLRVGLAALDPRVRGALVLLGDQPEVRAADVRKVLQAYRDTGREIVQASYRGRRGHPVLLDRAVWPRLAAVEGDTGARDLLAENPDRVLAVEIAGDVPEDVDTWDDYERLTAR